jgi:hypothetical protein
MHPEVFDHRTGEVTFSDSEAAVGLNSLLQIEREFALRAIRDAWQGTPPTPQENWDGIKKLGGQALTAGYQNYGLASGPHEAAELVRGLERDAVALVTESLQGRKP